MTDNLIQLVDYDCDWPNRYEVENEHIMDAVGQRVESIHHIGSTAVEGLAAKPIIDITATITDWNRVDDCISPLESIGYDYIQESANVETEWRYFEKRPNEGQAFNLHLRPVESEEVEDNLILRNHLRNNPETAREYEEVKRRAAANHPDDLKAYSDAKTEFITSIIETARDRCQ